MPSLTTESRAAGKPGLELAERGDTSLAVEAGAAPTRARTTKSLADLEGGIHHYPEVIKLEVIWLIGFYLTYCQANAISLRQIAAKLGHDKSVEYFYNVLNGYYFRTTSGTWKEGGKAWSEFLEMVDALRRYNQLAQRAGKLPFVITPTYNCIANFITAKRAPSAVCKIGGILAPTGGQTSESFKFYRDLNNHFAVVHLETPANGRPATLQRKVAEQYNEKGYKITYVATREQAISNNVNETRTIIFDNAQNLYNPRGGRDQPCFNWIRELYDDKRPTIILKFTLDFFSDLVKDEARGYLEQFIGRMGGLNSILHLPDYAPAADLRVIARSFHLEPGEKAMKFLHDWSRESGRIRIVFDRLQRAQAFAKEDGRERVTLDDLQEAKDYRPPAVGSDEQGGGK